MIERLLRSVRRGSRYRIDMRRAIAVEETLAKVRVVMTGLSLGAVVPLHLSGDPHIIAMATTVFLYAAGALLVVRSGRVRTPGHITFLDTSDLGIAILLTLHSGGAASPYSTVYLFALLATGYRYGQHEVTRTCVASIAALSGHAVVAHVLGWPGAPDPPFVLLRLGYLGMGGVLVGYMAGVEQRQRERAATATRILGLVGAQSSVVTAMHGLVNELIRLCGASHMVVTLEEEERDLVTVWRGDRAESGASRHAIRAVQEPRNRVPTYLLAVPAEVSAWLVTRHPGKPGHTGVALLALGHDGHDVPVSFSIDPLLDTPFAWTRALCLTYPAAQGMNARVFLFLPPGVRAGRVELRDVQAIMREVGPAIVNLYLQRRLQSRSAVVERTRISRELHDGVIQALIGVEMQLEVTRRQADGQVPATITRELMHIQQIIGQEVLNVRDLMQMLKPMDVDAARLVEYLASTVEQFRQRTGIRARFACGVEDIDLSPRVCREIASIVQEALANVRKHSEATSVLVRLDTQDGDWRVTIDDNGRGLDFEGYLSAEEIESQRKGPVIIKERTRAINGQLSIHSHPGFGTKLEIRVPRRHHG